MLAQKDKALIYLSLAISIVALCDTVWVHEHADQIADRALQKRELEFVQKFAPRIRETYEGMGETNFVANPTNLDQLFAPLVDSLNAISGSVTNDQK
ncbi:MAG TPA: hypothetical protein VMF08_05735 [Candidatus Sulfotelmatobacter sp.]|nr:hypothetical protein [Candidatus Sulfotelmatobacter sp.]